MYGGRYIPAPDFIPALTDQMQYKSVKQQVHYKVMRICNVAAAAHSPVFSNLQIGQISFSWFC